MENEKLIPLLLRDGNSTVDDLMLLLLLESMKSTASSVETLFLDGILRKFSTEKEDHELLLLTVLMNIITSGKDKSYGFDKAFNMLLPVLLRKCEKLDQKCKKIQKNLLVVLMAQQGMNKYNIYISDIISKF